MTHVGIDSEAFGDNYIICLGEHSMFIVNEDMSDIRGEVFYAHIIRLVI